jgi:membrane protein DedA with SNARE-associated domain
MLYEGFLKVVTLVQQFGYLGIFTMTFIESTFIPIPAEITLIPAGYLVQKAEMNGILVLIVSTLGTLAGSLLNYFIAYHYGRRIFINYGKYFLLNKDQLTTLENFFEQHGAISTFTGRLLPGLKHFISFPAGLAKMNIKIFSSFTATGGAIWCGILLLLGHFIGQNEQLIHKYLKQVNFIIFAFVVCLVGFYIWKKKIDTRQRLK